MEGLGIRIVREILYTQAQNLYYWSKWSFRMYNLVFAVCCLIDRVS